MIYNPEQKTNINFNTCRVKTCYYLVFDIKQVSYRLTCKHALILIDLRVNMT